MASHRPTVEEINAILLEDVGSKDGAIEPLEIRDVATRRTNPKDIAHKVCGTLEEGNVNDRTSSEVFFSRARQADLHVGSFPFEDEANTVGDMPIASETISPDNRRHGSFRDDQEHNGIIVSELSMESDIKAALRAMRPPSENILPPNFVQVGATGFDYGFAGSGPSTHLSYEYQRAVVSLIRQILPRREIRDRDRRSGAYPVKSKTGDKTRTGRNPFYFDDARTVKFLTGVNITHPTTLQFDPGRVAGDLTASFEATVMGNVDPYAVDQFVPHNDQSERVGPFFESNLFEQNETNVVNSKFMTGAAYGIAPDRFKSKISNKTILRMEFPLTRVSQMASGSEIMYLNPSSGSFVSKALEASFLNNGQGIGLFTFAPLPFTPYGMAYMPLNDYSLNGSFGGGGLLTPPQAEQSVKRMTTYAGDGSDSAFFTVDDSYSLGFVTSSVLNSRHVASDEQLVTLTNTLGHPFLLEKIVVEFPFQAGPGWLNDNFRLHEALANDLQFTSDGGGPLITFAIMRQDGADSKFRDIIASGTITSAMDMQTGIYSAVTGVYGGAGGFTDYMVTPNGVAQLGIVPNVVVTGSVLSGSDNFFTGTLKMTMDPQITSHVLRARVSGSSFFFVPDLLSYTSTFGTVFGSIARRSSKYIESGRSVFGNDFALLDPSKLDERNNPTHVMDNQYEDFPQKGTPPRFTNSKMYLDVKSNTIKSPYLLYPQDKLVFCLSKHRACGDDSILNDVFGGSPPLTPSNMFAYHDVAIGTGSLKVTLYGDLVREDTEFHDTLNQRLETEELWQDVGEDPVLDQFDVAYRVELSGSYLDRFSVLNTLTYATDVLTSSLEVTQLYSSFSSKLQDVPISNFAAWTKGKRVFELAKSSRNLQCFSNNEIYWDTRLVNPALAMKKANPSFAICGVDAVFGNTSVVLYTGDSQTLSSGISSSGQGVSEWFMGFPYEPKFNGITSTFSLGKDIMPTNFGSKRIFSYNDIAFEFGDTINRALMVGDFGSNFTTNVLPQPKNEFIKYFYGIGGGYGKRDNQHVRGGLMGAAGSSDFVASSSARIRGWKYGMMNGFAQRTKQVYRRDHYGQPRDLLEQRLDAKIYDEIGLASDGTFNGVVGVKDAPVQVAFYDSAGSKTDAVKTLSCNVSLEATSSLPYFDGQMRNRPEYDLSLLNIVNVTI